MPVAIPYLPMIVGLLSDTHGHYFAAKAGVDLLIEAGSEMLIHCGDVGDTDILDLLAGPVPSYFVFGNNDWDRQELSHYATHVGVTCLDTHGFVSIDGQPAIVMHGDDAALRVRILREQRHRYLFQGHTHVQQDQLIGECRVINPGALYRAQVKTVATLDTISGTLTWHDIGNIRV